MLHYLVYLIFILSAALAAGGVILSSRLRERFRHEIFSTLLYFQIFIFTFGFYGIWGQVVINAFLASYISSDLLARFSEISMLLGLPFLVFGWLMLMKFALSISGRENNGWFVLWFLLFNISVIIVVGYFINRTNGLKPLSLIKYYFILMNFLYTFLVSALILFPGKGRPIIVSRDIKIISISLILIMLSQCIPLLFNTSESYIAMLFIFTFFAGYAFLPVYINYVAILRELTEEPLKDLSLDEFCKKFEISPRETDIIREIYKGLSNQEISNKLFISLQTVKDHSHRIYSKTNVKSRVQLINLVKGLI